MSNDLEFLVRRIRVRIRRDDPTAIDAAIRLTEQYPREASAWKTLAHAYAANDNYSAENAALSRAIELEPKQFVLLLERGRNELLLGNHDQAIADFSQALLLCDEQNVDWCRRELYFLRAEARVLISRKVEALADLTRIPEDYEFFTTEWRSKAELLALCADAVTADNDGRYQGPPEEPRVAGVEPHNWQLPESPDENEAMLTAQLGPEGLAKADATLLRWVPQRWAKVARVVSEAIEDDDFDPTDTLLSVYLRRLIALVDAGAIESAGNLRRPRFSEVRLPEPD